MKNIIAHFIRYPVSVNVLILSFLLFGLMGVLKMKSSFFPLTDSKFIRINIIYPGASPEEIEEGVVLKIEDNLEGTVGIERVTSVSKENAATITVEIEKGQNIDAILSEVKNAVDRVPSFPSEMEPPVISKLKTTRETISFTISGDHVPLKTLKEFARGVEADLRGMEGISQVQLSGFPPEEIEVAVLEHNLRAYQLTFQEVARAVSESNILTTGGNIKTEVEEYLIRASNRSYHGDKLGDLVVRSRPDGTTIRLKDVAQVRDRWSETPDRLYHNGEEAIRIRVSNTNNEDLIRSAKKINQYIEDFNRKNENIRLDITNDSSITLIQRTQLLAKNGIAGMILVLALLSFFLHPRLALWVAAGLPIALFGMFIFAPSLGVTINVLSLFGMIIVIGILVDDGIVIAENIYHHYEKGKTPIRAAIDGTMEVMPPIVSAILTTVVAFSTFFFLEGRVGEYFGEVSTVVILTLVISLVEALIILPSHIAHSRALREGKKTKSKKRLGDTIMDFLRDKAYTPALRFFLHHKVLGFCIFASLFAITIGGIGGGIIRTTFFPDIASDRIDISLTMPQGTNQHITDSIISEIEKTAWEINEEYTAKQRGNVPVVENILKRIGPGSNTGRLTINLLPGENRDFTSSEITNAIQKKAGNFYGIERLIYSSGSIFGGKPVSISLLGNNIRELKAAKTEVKRGLAQNPLLKDVIDNDPLGIKEIKIKLRESAYPLGLNLASIMSQVRSGFFGFSAQRFQRGQDEIRVWVRYDRETRSSLKNLGDMWINTPLGSRVPFGEIASYEIKRGEVAINHLGGRREIRVEADLANPKSSASDILNDIRTNMIPQILAKYPTVSPLYEGQNREASKISSSAKVVLPVVLFFIYAIIAFTFRSYGQPLLLMFMIPFGIIGVGWGHWFHDSTVNILSWLGIIALMGIMVNDGLVFIEKFNGYLKGGQKFQEALMHAGRSRFRPIFLTSITTAAGLAPLILEKSRQAQFLIPMAISIAYGIIVATFLTLLVLPILLWLSNSIKVYGTYLLTGRKPSREEVERAIKELKSEEDEMD